MNQGGTPTGRKRVAESGVAGSWIPGSAQVMFAKARTRTVRQETKQLLPRGKKLVWLTAALAIAVVVAALCSGNWAVKLWYTGRLESEDELSREAALSQLASLTDTDGWETVDCKRFSFRLPGDDGRRHLAQVRDADGTTSGAILPNR